MTTRLLGCFLALALTACGVASEGASDAVDAIDQPHSTTLSGTWKGTDGVERPAVFVVEQQGASARMLLALEGNACLAHSTVDVEMTTDGPKTDADVAGMHLVIEGTPSLDTLEANFEPLKDGPCPGQGGWASLTR